MLTGCVIKPVTENDQVNRKLGRANDQCKMYFLILNFNISKCFFLFKDN